MGDEQQVGRKTLLSGSVEGHREKSKNKRSNVSTMGRRRSKNIEN